MAIAAFTGEFPNALPVSFAVGARKYDAAKRPPPFVGNEKVLA
jgi:hypothetical protein